MNACREIAGARQQPDTIYFERKGSQQTSPSVTATITLPDNSHVNVKIGDDKPVKVSTPAGDIEGTIGAPTQTRVNDPAGSTVDATQWDYGVTGRAPADSCVWTFSGTLSITRLNNSEAGTVRACTLHLQVAYNCDGTNLFSFNIERP